MFANFANPRVFTNIFLLDFHFLVLLRGEGLAGLNMRSAAIALEPGRRLLAFQRKSDGAGLKLSRHNHA